MHICLISQEYPPDTNWGGIATYTQVLARQLVQAGERVQVICLAEGEEYVTEDMGVIVHRVSKTPKEPLASEALGDLAGISHWSLSFSQRVYEAVRDIHACEPIDVIEAPETCAQAVVSFKLLDGITKITRLHTPFFWVRHLNEIPDAPEHLLRDHLEKLQTELSNAVTSPTHAMAEVTRQRWGTENILVIPNFFNLQSYTPDLSTYHSHLEGDDYLLFFGRLELRKGVHILAEALPQVLDIYPNLRMAFVGSDSILNDGSMRAQLQDKLATFSERILFIDNIPHASLYPLIEKSRFVVLPSLWENFPYACIEAMALGKTVVTSDSGGFPEIIERGTNGILCRPGDADDLRENILSLLQQEDHSAIGQNAQQRVKDFDTSAVVSRMVDFYRTTHAESCGQRLRIAYILLHLPYPSETFILNEIISLQDLGLTILPVSLFAAPACHEELVEKLKEPILDLSDAEEETAEPNRFAANAEHIAQELSISSRLARLASLVAEHVVQQEVQHLHAHFATEASLISMLVSRLTGIPFSFTAHAYDLFNTNPEATGGLSLEDRLSLLMPEAAGVVTISDFNRSFLLKRIANQYQDKIHVVRCGIDPDRFSFIERRPSDTVTFLSVGRLVEKKGHEYLLRAFKAATLTADNLRLKIVGDGYLCANLESLADELGIADRVEFLGAVSSQVVREEMKSADVFALHSVTATSGDMEGIPVSLMEASATGLPVLTTRHSGMAELVIDGETGYLSDEKDLADLARRMTELALAPELRKRMGVAGRDVVSAQFNLIKETEKLRHLFRMFTSGATRKLNIAFLTNMPSNPTDGGGNVHVYQIAKQLLARGHRLYTNLSQESAPIISWTDEEFHRRGNEIDVFYIRIHGHPGNDELTLYRSVNPDAPCIWEVNAPLAELLSTGMDAAEIAKLKARRKELAKMVNAAVCVSAEMQQYVRCELGINNTTVIPNGSDPRCFTPLKRNMHLYPDSKFTVMWSGSATFPWQGHRIVEAVARRMRGIDPEVLFVLTTAGESKGNLLYLGRVPYDKMPEYMASADLGLCIYDSIDFYPEFFFSPLKLYDYMASGLPVLGSDLGQIQSALYEFECGLLTDTTVDDLIEKILNAKTHPVVAGQLGNNGRNAVLQHRNWRSIAIETERVMMPLVNRKNPKASLKASIVICTYNRSDLLMQSIIAAKDQNFPADRFEIVVVDNNSKDDTRAITEALALLSQIPIKYVFEPRQGLSFARNTGIEHASHEIVIFIDDDIDAGEHWLSEIVDAFADDEVACAGGPIRPVWPFDRPQWLHKSWEGFLTVSEFPKARENGYFSYPDYPWGANIAFRKSVFEQIGGFPTDLGRIGNSLLSNEELNLCKKIETAGFRIKFAPEAVIHHKIAPERLRKSWMLHRTYWQGRSDAILDAGTPPFSYQRLRDFACLMYRYQTAGEDLRFVARCIERNLMGYLHQSLMVPQERDAGGAFRKLRGLRSYLTAYSGTVLDALNQSNGRAGKLESAFDALQQKAQQDAQLIAGLGEETDRLKQSLEEAGLQLAQREQQLAELERQLSERNLQLAEQGDRICGLEQELSVRQQQLAERDRLISAKERQLREVYDSLSWKASAPLRGAYEFMGLARKAATVPPLPSPVGLALATAVPKPLETFPAQFAAGEVLEFPEHEAPLVSIVIPVYNQFGHTYSCLASILATTTLEIEVIIADDASQDETREISRYVKNIHHLRNTDNLGFLRNCNQAAASARGKYIVFLNNDTNVQKEWLQQLVDLMEEDPTVGMTGSKLVYPDGRLQEAGGIIWNDANGLNYGRLDDPAKPEYNYVKDVDYISGASIMIRRELWERIGGFDERFAPAYYEDTDLAFTVRKLGLRVVYQPKSVVVHFEGISHGTDLGSGIKSYQVRNKELFLDKWRETLAWDHFSIDEDLFHARDRSRHKKTLLFVDYQVPLFDMFAGSRTNYMYLRLLVRMGLNVKFIGADFLRIEPYSSELNRLGIKTLDGDWFRTNWKQWILDNADHLDYVLFNKPDTANMFIDFIKEHTRAKILYQGHDLHYLRLKRKFEVEGDRNALAESISYERMEKEIFRKSDALLTFSSHENDIISKLAPGKIVETVPLYFYDDFKPAATNFAGRKNIMFVGGFGHTPNVDAVTWFCREVLPLVLHKIPDIVLNVIGSNPPEAVTSLESAQVRIIGFVSDEKLVEFYNSSRMVVVPLRFGAGVKGKTIEAMYHGLPIVSTSVGIEGIPDIGSVLRAADSAQEFASQIAALYTEPGILQEAGKRNLEFVKSRYSTETAQKCLQDLLDRLTY